ncbi:MAG: 4Fe-4S binding protein [Lachnospiraceae bacterium]|nr:4Fe-4S binding protein [Lachnospiraceae bacterium]MBR6349624.1 4Fe-4S binding protein [Lachnospiraceae bacterium]
MKKVFTFDQDQCCACGCCVVACTDQNDIDLRCGDIPFRKTFDDEFATADGHYSAYISAACMHCVDAPCITACPVGCISKDPETGFTVYDNTNCIGCKSCAMACPFGAPRYRHSDGKMVKCDGCNERVKAGLKPACVKACPFGALDCVDEEEYLASGSNKACNVLIHNLDLRF